jgi:hypothetical protein
LTKEMENDDKEERNKGIRKEGHLKAIFVSEF